MSNPIRRWWERRSLATPSKELLALFSSGPTASGMTVDPQTALQVPAVFACVQVLSQDVARTPIRFRQQTAPETYVDAVDHPLFEILGSLPNPELTAYQFQHALMWQLLLYGRAYAEIVRVDGRIVALWPLVSEYMTVDRTASRQKRWTYRAGSTAVTWLFDPSSPPILELTSTTPLQFCREAIGSALALQQYTATFFKNNGKPSGVLQTVNKLDPLTGERLRDYWATNYGGSANRGKIPVLDQGLTFTPISSTNDDAQLTELHRSLNEQIAGAFRVPTSKIGDLSKANYSNMAVSEETYVNSSLDPYFVSWELALRRDVLTTRQYGQYSVSFDRAALTKNDRKALHDSLCQGIQNGIYSQNDARRKLGENPIPDGDRYLLNSALQPVGAPKEVPSAP
jgi:HK97 family phage portal protein